MSKTTTLGQLLALLTQALQEPLRRKEAVANFQAKVWHDLDMSLPNDVREILQELAYDLDFFEARNETRKEDGTLYGHVRLEQEIRTGIRKLQEVGVDIQAELNSQHSQRE